LRLRDIEATRLEVQCSG